MKHNAFIVIDYDGGQSISRVEHVSANSPEDLVAILKPYIDSYAQVFPYYGEQWFIGSSSEGKFLLDSKYNKYKISKEKVDDTVEIDTSGSLRMK